MPDSVPSFDDRKQIFLDAVSNDPDFGKGWVLKPNYGQSNTTTIIDGGILWCNSNLRGHHEKDIPGYAFASLVDLPPHDEFWLAAFVGEDIEVLRDRLKVMRDRGREGHDDFADNNKNTKFYLYSDKGFYLTNKKFYEGLSEPDGFVSDETIPHVKVDKVVYSVYSRSAVRRRNNVAAGAMVDLLSRFVESEKIVRIDPWPDHDATDGGLQQLPTDLDLTDIQSGIESLGGYYDPATVERYHIGLNHIPHKHFVVLTGLSGTGKTGLAIRYARTIHGIDSQEQEDPLLFMCPVRPEWTDPTGLIGYYDVIGDRYVVPPFLEAMLVARDNPSSPVFVCLDEMNLARVEYYFADILSAIESQEAIDLHSNSIPIQGNHGGEVPTSIHVPSNLYITGTINVDETTRPLSDKVLDRTVVLDLTASDPEGYLDWLSKNESDLQDAVHACQDLLVRVHSILAEENLAFGYRAAEEFVRYVSFARDHGTRDVSDLIDDQIVQKILPKLQGGLRQEDMLDELQTLFEDENLTRASEKIQGFKGELKELGSFQATR